MYFGSNILVYMYMFCIMLYFSIVIVRCPVDSLTSIKKVCIVISNLFHFIKKVIFLSSGKNIITHRSTTSSAVQLL